MRDAQLVKRGARPWRRRSLVEPLEVRVMLSLPPVLDINPRPAAAVGAVAAANGVAVFAHDDFLHGLEPWATDGTPAGTMLLKDIVPGPDGSQPNVLGAAGGAVYFTTDDGSADQQLWATDGTAAGTRALHDFSAADGGAFTFSNVVGAGGAAFFTAYRFGQKELWRSDGTPAGTTLVKTLPLPSAFINQPATELAGLGLGGTLFFRAYDAEGYLTLWMSDGTEPGTQTLQPAEPRRKIYNPSTFLDYGGRVMFTESGTARWWISDGTPAGTNVVAEVTLPFGGIVGGAAVFDGRVFFSVKVSEPVPAAGGAAAAALPGSYTDLWSTDGTQAGTRRVSNPAQPSPDAASGEVVAAGDFLYYTANARFELWRIDSADAEPVRIEQSQYPYIQGLTDVAGELYFLNRDSSNALMLFRADAGGVSPVPFAEPAPRSLAYDGAPIPVAVSGDRLFLDFHVQVGGNIQPYDERELWSVANDEAQAARAAVLVGGTLSSEPLGLKTLGGRVFFDANERSRGEPPDLWTSDGTVAGTAKVMNLGPISGRPPAAIGEAGGFMMFSVYNGRTVELWRTDGTPAGTSAVRPPGLAAPISVQTAVTMDGVLYFVAPDGSGSTDPALWKSDGTDAGTVLVKHPPYAGYLYPLVVVGHTLYFFQQGSANRVLVWKSDGTPDGTVLLQETFHYAATDAYAAGDRLVFTMEDISSRATWMSDGTAAGTAPVQEGQYAAVGESLYLRRQSASRRQQLWKIDGTEAGMVLLKEWDEGPTTPPLQYPAPPMMEAGGVLYFTASDPEHGTELWKTDGTVAGTVLVRDVAEGPADSRPRLISGQAGVLIFSADDQVHGRELWRADGTPDGAVLVADIQPGHEGSDPYEATWAGGTLFVTATTRAHGWEMWALRPQVTARHVFYDGSALDTGGPAGDDRAIAADKLPLLPGAAATWANLTSYTRGLNGVMIDVQSPRGLRAGSVSADDFEFRVSAAGNPASWTAAPVPASVTVRPGAGDGGADRVTLTWPDGAIANRWLRVTVKPKAATGLATPDVFYFGNLVGRRAGGAGALGPGGATVSALDLAGVRRALSTSAAPDNPFDHNRDGRVNALDLAAVRANLFRTLPAPQPIAATAAQIGATALALRTDEGDRTL